MGSFKNKLKRSWPSIEPFGMPAITTSDELVFFIYDCLCLYMLSIFQITI